MIFCLLRFKKVDCRIFVVETFKFERYSEAIGRRGSEVGVKLHVSVNRRLVLHYALVDFSENRQPVIIKHLDFDAITK